MSTLLSTIYSQHPRNSSTMAFTDDAELPLDDLTRHSTNTCSSRRSSAHDELDGKASHPPTLKKTASGDSLDDSTTEQLRKLSVHHNEEEKSWMHLDSVHSNTNKGYANPYLNNSLNASGDSMDFNDSCASFASFGGGSEDGENNNSKSSLNGSSLAESESLALATAAFCRLETESIIPKRRPPAIMSRAPSVRLNKGPSFRQTSLQLIEEKEDL
jgi:hypothetical protein